MAEYAITYFETYEKEADLKKMLLENPVPDNREQIQKLDSFLGDDLKDKHNQCVMDPLSKLWMLVEEA